MNGRLQQFWEFWRWARQSVLISPIILTLLLSFGLRSIGQFQEIFVSSADGENVLKLLLGFVALALLSMTLFFGYLSSWVVLRLKGIGYGGSLVYQSSDEIVRDRRIVVLRNWLAALCAALPLLFVAWGFWQSADKLEEKIQFFKDAATAAGLDGLTSDLAKALQQTEGLPARLDFLGWSWGVFALVMLGVLYLYGRLELRRRLFITMRPRVRTRIPWLVRGVCAAMLVGPLILQRWFPDAHDELFRELGPLATLGLVFTALAAALFIVGEWSRKVGLPILVIGSLLLVGFGVARWLVYTTPATQAISDDRRQPDKLHQQFSEWLKHRRDAAGFKKYPVFIIAAQGGGIYAASAAANFLAGLQARCPNFAQHVFAISAVSGGSIGTALFENMEPWAQTDQHCAELETEARERKDQSPSAAAHKRVRELMRDDYLSPSLAVFIPDVLYGFVQVLGYEASALVLGNGKLLPKLGGRADALECSFVRSLVKHGPNAASAGTLCSGNEPVGLRGPFKAHWQSDGTAAVPALILNTTWTETGDRVAFAPFSLDGVGDRTLFGFFDLNATTSPGPELSLFGSSASAKEVACVKAAQQAQGPTLIEAAVGSARFPAVLPAMIAFNGPCWWNLVDGGYADGSGATTALEIYEALADHIRGLSKNSAKSQDGDEARLAQPNSAGTIRIEDVDLRLILLSDVPVETNTDTIQGNGVVHSISPLRTLFSVRSQISRRAVARAKAELSRDAEGSPASKDKVVLVVLDHESYNLPLGWMMSRATAEIVARFAGRPGETAGARVPVQEKEVTTEKERAAERERVAKIKRAADILRENSRISRVIVSLLAGGG